MKPKNIHVSADFSEVDTRTLDGRHRVCVGDILKGFERVQIFLGPSGEVLLRPMVELPASEAWLFKNKKALDSVRKGLEDAKNGKISKLDLDKL